MSSQQFEIKVLSGKVYKVDAFKVKETIKKMVYVNFVKGRFPLDDTCEIRQGESEWFALTKSFCDELMNAGWDLLEMIKQRQIKAETMQKEQVEAVKEIEKIHSLRAKCRNGEWSLGELQYIFQLVRHTPLAPNAEQGVDDLSQAQNKLVDDVIKSPHLTEPLKIMYSNAQLGMQQQILANLEQLSSNQAQSNAILKQNQKSGNQKAAAGMLGGIVALNKLGDIADSLDDE